MSNVRLHPIVEELRKAWPDEWRDGARCGFLERLDGAREPGGYPLGFHSWPVAKRNAWFAGYNRGNCDRIELASLKTEVA